MGTAAHAVTVPPVGLPASPAPGNNMVRELDTHCMLGRQPKRRGGLTLLRLEVFARHNADLTGVGCESRGRRNNCNRREADAHQLKGGLGRQPAGQLLRAVDLQPVEGAGLRK
jgi:hypothetical protein